MTIDDPADLKDLLDQVHDALDATVAQKQQELDRALARVAALEARLAAEQAHNRRLLLARAHDREALGLLTQLARAFAVQIDSDATEAYADACDTVAGLTKKAEDLVTPTVG